MQASSSYHFRRVWLGGGQCRDGAGRKNGVDECAGLPVGWRLRQTPIALDRRSEHFKVTSWPPLLAFASTTCTLLSPALACSLPRSTSTALRAIVISISAETLPLLAGFTSYQQLYTPKSFITLSNSAPSLHSTPNTNASPRCLQERAVSTLPAKRAGPSPPDMPMKRALEVLI